MTDYEKGFLEAISYLSEEERGSVLRALKKVQEWHEGQTRESGEPYVIHLIATANFLAQLQCGPHTLIAGLLHDVVEDERATLKDVEEHFGAEIAKLVDGVTKLTRVRYEGGRTERQVASLRKLLLAASEDLRVIFIKLADRLHNVETLAALRPDKQERIARETLDIYVPFARLTGLWWMKRRLEECCFPLAFGEEARVWHEHIRDLRQELRHDRLAFLEELKKAIRVPVSVQLSEMTDYELFEKCGHNIRLLSETSIFDSILVFPQDPDMHASVCYTVLGDIHQRFAVRPRSFLDFIAQPLPNGYRALHTTVFIAYNHEVRIRIQTLSMKEYDKNRAYATWIHDRKNDLYRALHHLHQNISGHEEYLSDLRNDVLKEKVLVFTPSGDIVALPRGSNGIDLAFALDPEFLSRLSKMRVNAQECEVTHVLKDGDTVELIFHSGEESNGGHEVLWRQRAHTLQAKEALRHAAQSLPEEELRSDGRVILEHECRKFGLPVWWLFRFCYIQDQVCELCGEKSFGEVLRKVGAGILPVQKVAQAYQQAIRVPRSLFVRLLIWWNLLWRLRSIDPDASRVHLEIVSEDRPGMLYDLVRCFADRKMNIVRAQSVPMRGESTLHRIVLTVDDFRTFSDLYDALLQVPGVKSMVRLR